MARAPVDQAEPTVEDLSARIAELQAEIAAMSADLKEKGAQFADGLRARGEQAASEAKSRAQHALGDAETAMRENPATAMAVAAGVGFLLGVLLSRR